RERREECAERLPQALPREEEEREERAAHRERQRPRGGEAERDGEQAEEAEKPGGRGPMSCDTSARQSLFLPGARVSVIGAPEARASAGERDGVDGVEPDGVTLRIV